VTRASARRVASRFRRAGKVRVEVLMDETEEAIKRFGKGIAVARMLDSVPMFRVMDGEELRSVLGSGEITGGSFSVDGERAFGAQWGASLPEVAKFGHDWRRSGRLGNELFIAEMDGKDRVFAHLTGFGGELQPDSGVISVDSDSCSTGLGCSFRVKDSEVKQWHVVDESGKTSRISKSDLGKMVSQVGLKPRDVDLWMGWSVSTSNIPPALISALQKYTLEREWQYVDKAWRDARSLPRDERPISPERYERMRMGEMGITPRSGMDPDRLSQKLFKLLGQEKGSIWSTSMSEATRVSQPGRTYSTQGVFALTFCVRSNVAVPNQIVDLKGKTGSVKRVQLYLNPMTGIGGPSSGRWEDIWQPWGSAKFSWRGKNLTVR
jgi:hypothetical protein